MKFMSFCEMSNEADKFRFALKVMFQAATDDNQPYLDVEAGPWHRAMGGYPARDGKHSMPTVCDVMWKEFSDKHGDKVLYSPPRKRGASLKIRYQLPR